MFCLDSKWQYISPLRKGAQVYSMRLQLWESKHATLTYCLSSNKNSKGKKNSPFVLKKRRKKCNQLLLNIFGQSKKKKWFVGFATKCKKSGITKNNIHVRICYVVVLYELHFLSNIITGWTSHVFFIHFFCLRPKIRRTLCFLSKDDPNWFVTDCNKASSEFDRNALNWSNISKRHLDNWCQIQSVHKMTEKNLCKPDKTDI